MKEPRTPRECVSVLLGGEAASIGSQCPFNATMPFTGISLRAVHAWRGDRQRAQFTRLQGGTGRAMWVGRCQSAVFPAGTEGESHQPRMREHITDLEVSTSATGTRHKSSHLREQEWRLVAACTCK